MGKARLGMAAAALLACALVWLLVPPAVAQDAQQGVPPDAATVPSTVNDTTTGAGNSLKSDLPPQALPTEQVVLKSSFIARQLAQQEWFDKAAAANPRLVAAVCTHPWAAAIVAKHRHIAQIADADHYLCRRLTQHYWATKCLLSNPHADHVICLDPQGIYYAIEKRPSFARLVAGHVMFYEMVQENPDLGNFIIAHMK